MTRHILIVDDNLANRRLLQHWLRRKGYRTSEAYDGREALQRLTSGNDHYDLVLMDYHMPEMNGMDATRALRDWESEHALARLPVVAITASEGLVPNAEFFAAGMDLVLPKPICFKTLERELRLFLQ